MSIKDKGTINILNYNDNPVVVSTRDTAYVLEPASGNVPSKTPFTIPEIQTMHGNGNAFESGNVRFEEEDEAEIYEILRIVNWKDILTNDEIVDIILNPTYEGLKRIVDVKSSSVFERIRGIYTRLKNDECNDISNRIERIITTRYRELISGKSKTEIVLTPKDSKKATSINVDEIKNQNEALMQQIAEMQKKFDEFVKSKEKTDKGNEQVDAELKEKKPAGRPKIAK